MTSRELHMFAEESERFASECLARGQEAMAAGAMGTAGVYRKQADEAERREQSRRAA